MTLHKTSYRRRRHQPKPEVERVRQETQQLLDMQSKRIAQLEAHLDEVLATSDELQAQFLKLRRDALLSAGQAVAH